VFCSGDAVRLFCPVCVAVGVLQGVLQCVLRWNSCAIFCSSVCFSANLFCSACCSGCVAGYGAVCVAVRLFFPGACYSRCVAGCVTVCFAVVLLRECDFLSGVCCSVRYSMCCSECVTVGVAPSRSDVGAMLTTAKSVKTLTKSVAVARLVNQNRTQAGQGTWKYGLTAEFIDGDQMSLQQMMVEKNATHHT